jgi:Cytochrome P450
VGRPEAGHLTALVHLEGAICESLRLRPVGPHEWFPFWGGNRVCMGMPFALYEMKVLLATVLKQVRLSWPAGAQSRNRRHGIVLGPEDGGGSSSIRPVSYGPLFAKKRSHYCGFRPFG